MNPSVRSTNSHAIWSDRFPDRLDMAFGFEADPIALTSPVIGAGSIDTVEIGRGIRGA
jgi:hypothetical protein